jgi:hypothetical protein
MGLGKELKKLGKGVKEFVFGKKPKKPKQATTIDPIQAELEQLISDALTKNEGPLSDIFGKFNEEEFNKGVRDPAFKDFKDTVLPEILERYRAGGAPGGSGQQYAANKAGTDLLSNLAQTKYAAQQGQKQNKISGANTAFARQTVENYATPGVEGVLKGLIESFAGGVGGGAGAGAAKATPGGI